MFNSVTWSIMSPQMAIKVILAHVIFWEKKTLLSLSRLIIVYMWCIFLFFTSLWSFNDSNYLFVLLGVLLRSSWALGLNIYDSHLITKLLLPVLPSWISFHIFSCHWKSHTYENFRINLWWQSFLKGHFALFSGRTSPGW